MGVSTSRCATANSTDITDFLKALRDAKVAAFVSVEYYEPKMRDHIPPLKHILELNQVMNPRA